MAPGLAPPAPVSIKLSRPHVPRPRAAAGRPGHVLLRTAGAGGHGTGGRHRVLAPGAGAPGDRCVGAADGEWGPESRTAGAAAARAVGRLSRAALLDLDRV